jgi:sulfane dehydrogenase subunit SoxC
MIGGALVASAAATRIVEAAPLPIPESEQKPGRPIPPSEYGMPSKFEAGVLRRRTDVFVNRQNLSDWSMTPLQNQLGIVTPNGLFFERHPWPTSIRRRTAWSSTAW